MAVQLLPFQKMADIPDVAQRHRCAIRGLAITSIVLVFSILFFGLIPTLATISTTSADKTSAMLWLGGFPLMTIVLVLVLVSSIISLRNTDKWVPADACCNVMRSQPACCTKSCGGNKHCCARLSSVFIAASVFSSLLFVLLVSSLIVACTGFPPGTVVSSDQACGPYAFLKSSGTQPSLAACVKTCEASSECMMATLYSSSSKTFPMGCDHFSAECRPFHDVGSTTVRLPRRDGDGEVDNSICRKMSAAEAAGLILLVCLIATTARAAWLVRAIEKEQADIAVLPPNKMVTQVTAGNMMMMQRTVVGTVCVVDQEEPKTETRTEQNVQSV